MRVAVWTWRIGLVFLCSTPLGACGAAETVPPLVEEGPCSGTTPAFEEVAAFQTCVMCHSPEVSEPARKGAPESVNFDVESGAEAKAEQIAAEVKAGRMPPPSSGLKLTVAERETLLTWATCR